MDQNEIWTSACIEGGIKIVFKSNRFNWKDVDSKTE